MSGQLHYPDNSNFINPKDIQMILISNYAYRRDAMSMLAFYNYYHIIPIMCFTSTHQCTEKETALAILHEKNRKALLLRGSWSVLVSA